MRQSLLAIQSQPPAQLKRTDPAVTTSRPFPSVQFINGRLVQYDDNQQNYVIKGYNINDIVYSIVRLITDKARVAPWGIYKIEDEQAYKQLTIEQKRRDQLDYVKIINLHRKALKPVANAGKWGELIKWPNEEEDFNNLVANSIAFRLITGNSYKWANMLQAGANAGTPAEIFLQPSQYMQIYTTGLFPVRKTGYFNSLFNVTFKKEHVCHTKYFNPNFDLNGQEMYGMAPLKAGLLRLQKSNNQIKSEANKWGNEGISGVFSFDVKPGEVDGETVMSSVVDPFKETMRNEWVGVQNRNKMGISGYKVEWIPVGLNAEEMQLIESGVMDIRYMCNLFGGIPSQLLNDPDNKIYANAKEGEKHLTSRCVLPELCSEKDSLNRKMTTDWGLPKGQVADFDMTVFPELANDAKEVATWTSQLTAMIPNEQREQCGLAAYPDKVFDEPWVMQGGSRIPLSEWKIQPVDESLSNEDE